MDCEQGLEYLHASKIGVHGQLTIINCLVDSRWAVRLTDYGLERVFDLFYNKGSILRKPTSLLSTVVSRNSSMFYDAREFLLDLEKRHLAPELSTENGKKGNLMLTPAADIYSFGMVMYQILFRKLLVDPSGMLTDA